MNPGDKKRILRGEVFYGGRWVPIEQKLAAALQHRKKIEDGYVFYQGEWITIDEKIARVAPPKVPAEKRPETIVVNINDNRTFYNVDKRTVFNQEHRHVHLDRESLEEYVQQKLPKDTTGDTAAIESDKKSVKALPDRKQKKLLTNEGKETKSLPPPKKS
jgi:hypothetical protein